MIKINTLFPYLKNDDLNLLNEILTYKIVPKKTIIISSNQESYNFFYVIKGVVRGYFINETKKEIDVFLGNEKQFFGAPETILKSECSKYNFETINKCELIQFNFLKLEKIAMTNKNIFKLYTDSLKEVMSTFIGRLEGFTSDSPEQRFLDLHENRPLLISTAHKKEIATFLGVSPNSLSRIISRINNKTDK